MAIEYVPSNEPHKRDCRDLGIGGDAHKKIDAAVRKGGFEIVSRPFELGMHCPRGMCVIHLHHVLPAWPRSAKLSAKLFQKTRHAATPLHGWHGMQNTIT